MGGEAMRSSMAGVAAGQVNLPLDTLNRAFDGHLAGQNIYTIRARGGNVRLKYFSPKEGGRGVAASPWGRTTVYAGTFMTSGRPGARRMSPKLGGHVYERVDKSNRGWFSKIRQARAGLYIPDEMVKGATFATFKRGVMQIGGEIATRVAAALP